MNYIDELDSKALNRPGGSIEFKFPNPGIGSFDGKKVLWRTTAEVRAFRLVALASGKWAFDYSSPGTGAFRATVDPAPLKDAENLHVVFAWRPDGTAFRLMDAADPSCVVADRGEEADFKLLARRGDGIVQLHPGTHQAAGYQGGVLDWRLSAIDSWETNVSIVEELRDAGVDGCLKGITAWSRCITTLITALEDYLQKRFIEISWEGNRISDEESLDKEFLPSRYQGEDGRAAFLEKAQATGQTPVEYLATEFINFQNLADVHQAYRRGFGLGLWDSLSVDHDALRRIEDYIKYRHVIVHVDPRPVALNPEGAAAGEDPIPPNQDLVEKAIEDCNGFVAALHTASLAPYDDWQEDE